ncbi:DUF2225 domain-containing protein [Helicovermis profundi]|uniref:Cyclic nucleotide-binding domain-containing protein n=1 Tax=Helicovermis profundi TaxID=3065157 RepID=A0AAU9E943_9FIRM|nr:hypothetical protein HLPR_22990 [Clostridia bacterium S502]
MINKVVLNSGEIVYKKGEMALSFYFVLKGSINLIDENNESNFAYKQIMPNSFFGAYEFFSEISRSYTAVCLEDVELELVDKSNIENFVSRNSIMSFDLLKQLSNELKLANEELINKSSTKIFNNDKEFMISKIEDDFVVETDRVYRKAIPKEHVIYLFDKEVECPVCREKFKVNQIKYSKLKLKVKLEDGRKIYDGIDELWYQIWHCPLCNYANFQNSFYKINNKVREELREKLPRNVSELRLVKTSINDVFKDYFYLSRIINMFSNSSFLKARLWQSIVWLLEDVEDEENVNKAKRILRGYYEDAWFNSTEYINPNDEVKLTMKIGTLYFEDGDIRTARDYLLKGTQVKGASKILKQELNNRLISIKKIYSNKKESYNN